MNDLVELVARKILAAEIAVNPGVWESSEIEEWPVEDLERNGYGMMAREAIRAAADYLETQRRNVPAHGWEFANALRLEAQTGKTDE